MHPAAVRSISSTALLVLLSLSGWKRSRHKQPVPRTARNASLTPEERYVPLRREPKLFESLLRDEWLTPEARAVAWRCGLSPLDSASTAAFSPIKDSVKNYRVHPTHWLICAQAGW